MIPRCFSSVRLHFSKLTPTSAATAVQPVLSSVLTGVSAVTAAAFARTGAVYMVGDWTNRDAAIAAVLAENGRAGVPLYLVYPKGGGEAAVLPQLLTEGMVIRALEDAAK